MKSTVGTVIMMVVVAFLIMWVAYMAFTPIRESISNNAVQQYKKTENGNLTQAEAISNRVGLLNGILTVIPMIIVFFVDKLIWKRHKSFNEQQDDEIISDSEGSFIYYCRNCGNVFSGPQDLGRDDSSCPSCGQPTILTDMPLGKWQTLSGYSQQKNKQKWNNVHANETPTNETGNQSAKKDDIKEKLQQIKEFYENGLITAEEYDKKRKELLDNI